jgi:TonB family protein
MEVPMRQIVGMAFLLLMGFASLAQEAEPGPAELSPEAGQALLVKKVPPVYPPLARQARIQATVVLKIVINKDGDVRAVQLVSGHPLLAPAAIEAVKQWKYQPYIKDGEAVEVSTTVRVTFSLAGEPAPAGTVGDVPGGATGGGLRIDTPAGYERVSEAKMRTLRIQKIDPLYPPLALEAHIQGLVVLDLMISAAGEVENVKLVSGHPILAPASVEAVKQWKYMPYVKDGSAVAVATRVRLSYTLSENGAAVVGEPPIEAMKLTSAGQTPPQLSLPQRVRVSAGVSEGMLVDKVSPEYPPDARDQRVQGTVILHVNIDKEGNVSNVQLVSGHPMLAPAAIEAVRQWKYRPYLLNGEAVEVDTEVRVNFTLVE